jgi:hypothetical protein
MSKNFQTGISEPESLTPYIKHLQQWANQRVSEDLEARRNPTPLPPIKTYKIQGSGNNIYTLTVRGTHKSCSCPGYVYRRQCKHVISLFGRV